MSRGATMGDIYLCWMADMSWRTCVVVKQMQSIHPPGKSWGDCTNQTSNWPYQVHKVPHLVPRTANCLSTLWPDFDYWTHAPGVYRVTVNSWWILHSWLIEVPLGDSSLGFHSRVSDRSWILLSDMNGHISSATHYLNYSPTNEMLNLN